MGSNIISSQCLINLDQLDVNFWKINNVFWHLTNKQYTETHSLSSEEFACEILFQRYDVMRTLWYIIITITMLINSIFIILLMSICISVLLVWISIKMFNHCSAINAQNFQTREHKYSMNNYILKHKKPFSYSHSEIIICIYSVRGEIDQISTNPSRYTM